MNNHPPRITLADVAPEPAVERLNGPVAVWNPADCTGAVGTTLVPNVTPTIKSPATLGVPDVIEIVVPVAVALVELPVGLSYGSAVV